MDSLKLALRRLFKSPSVRILAVLTLALAIGANTTALSHPGSGIVVDRGGQVFFTVAAGQDGVTHFSGSSEVRRMTPHGEVSTLASHISVDDRHSSLDGTAMVVAAAERIPGGGSRPVPSHEASTFKGVKAGEEKEVGGIRLCWCPPGRFRMGSPPAEIGRRADEGQVEVTLTRGFWTGKFEVTQGQWKREMGAIPGDLIAGEGDDFPVYWVNFVEAEGFCRRLTERTRGSGELPAGWEFRLPTEAQWEYACRAGSSIAFAFGESLTRTQANIGKPYDGTPDGTPGAAAVRVGSYPANTWGLHDMHGNEFEWCRDWYHAQLPGGIDPDLRETQGVPNRDGTYSRVRRGGAWMDEATFCRSAFRLRYEPPRRSDHIGFRIVVVRP